MIERQIHDEGSHEERDNELARISFFVWGPVLLVMQTGCATHNLWLEKDTFIPACPDGLALFESPYSTDILVTYREKRAGHDHWRLRTYLLLANATNTAARHTPNFLRAKPAGYDRPVPLPGRKRQIAPRQMLIGSREQSIPSTLCFIMMVSAPAILRCRRTKRHRRQSVFCLLQSR
jgi:hypothetical protein